MILSQCIGEGSTDLSVNVVISFHGRLLMSCGATCPVCASHDTHQVCFQLYYRRNLKYLWYTTAVYLQCAVPFSDNPSLISIVTLKSCEKWIVLLDSTKVPRIFNGTGSTTRADLAEKGQQWSSELSANNDNANTQMFSFKIQYAPCYFDILLCVNLV